MSDFQVSSLSTNPSTTSGELPTVEPIVAPTIGLAPFIPPLQEAPLVHAAKPSSHIFRACGSHEVVAFGQTMRVLLSGCVTNDSVAVLEFDIPPHDGPPLHVHRAEDETFFVKQGRFEFTIGTERVEVSAGDIVYGPRGLPHTFRNLNDEAGVLQVIAVSAGFQSFFTQCAEEFAAGGDMGRIMKIAADHQLEFLDPSAELSTVSASNGKKPRVIRRGEGEFVMTPHGGAHIFLSEDDTAGDFALVALHTASLGGPPLHVHSREDEVFIVQEGTFEYSTAHGRCHAHTGDVIWAPRHISHTFRCISDQSGTLLSAVLPAEYINFMRESARLFEQGQFSETSMVQLSARYGIEFLSPEI